MRKTLPIVVVLACLAGCKPARPDATAAQPPASQDSAKPRDTSAVPDPIDLNQKTPEK